MHHVLEKLISALELGQPAVLCAIVRNSGSAPRTSGARMVVLKDGSIAGSVGGGILEGQCQTKAKDLFHGPITFAELNFQLTAASAAEEGMACGGYPEAKEIRVVTSFTDCLGQLGQDDYVVIVTRDHHHDCDVLAQALRGKAGYIGMIGSRRKRAAIYDSLRREGVNDADLARVHCPIGLAIDAETPEELALSIVAELVQTRAKITAPRPTP